MRHRVAGKKLGRTRAHRQAMFANMAASLIRHGRVETTLVKAKALRSLADRMVTLGKKGTVAARRRAVSLIRDKKAVAIAFGDLAARFAKRDGGYTRVLKLGYRHGDSASMAVIEYLPEKGGAAEEGAPKKAAPAKATKKAKPKAAEKEKPARKAKAAKPAAKKAPAKKKSTGKKKAEKK